eukprot:TRINITY_DN311_c4_g1_i1.p1 TRINITY_DN311_c4_g1~~TRINITY_DN311_c4_g1_i1.p1  ORF type:complete len:1981 (-),score=640.81 TRINITY_DN311_c4_g1_i1:153-6095(-)
MKGSGTPKQPNNIAKIFKTPSRTEHEQIDDDQHIINIENESTNNLKSSGDNNITSVQRTLSGSKTKRKKDKDKKEKHLSALPETSPSDRDGNSDSGSFSFKKFLSETPKTGGRARYSSLSVHTPSKGEDVFSPTKISLSSSHNNNPTGSLKSAVSENNITVPHSKDFSTSTTHTTSSSQPSPRPDNSSDTKSNANNTNTNSSNLTPNTRPRKHSAPEKNTNTVDGEGKVAILEKHYSQYAIPRPSTDPAKETPKRVSAKRKNPSKNPEKSTGSNDDQSASNNDSSDTNKSEEHLSRRTSSQKELRKASAESSKEVLSPPDKSKGGLFQFSSRRKLTREYSATKAVRDKTGNSDSSSTTTTFSKSFIEHFEKKAWLRITERESNHQVKRRAWKRFIYRINSSSGNNVNGKVTLITAYTKAGQEVPELNIDLTKISSVDQVEVSEQYSENKKYAFVIHPLKLIMSTSKDSERVLWIKILRDFIKAMLNSSSSADYSYSESSRSSVTATPRTPRISNDGDSTRSQLMDDYPSVDMFINQISQDSPTLITLNAVGTFLQKKRPRELFLYKEGFEKLFNWVNTIGSEEIKKILEITTTTINSDEEIFKALFVYSKHATNMITDLMVRIKKNSIQTTTSSTTTTILTSSSSNNKIINNNANEENTNIFIMLINLMIGVMENSIKFKKDGWTIILDVFELYQIRSGSENFFDTLIQSLDSLLNLIIESADDSQPDTKPLRSSRNSDDSKHSSTSFSSTYMVSVVENYMHFLFMLLGDTSSSSSITQSRRIKILEELEEGKFMNILSKISEKWVSLNNMKKKFLEIKQKENIISTSTTENVPTKTDNHHHNTTQTIAATTASNKIDVSTGKPMNPTLHAIKKPNPLLRSTVSSNALFYDPNHASNSSAASSTSTTTSSSIPAPNNRNISIALNSSMSLDTQSILALSTKIIEKTESDQAARSLFIDLLSDLTNIIDSTTNDKNNRNASSTSSSTATTTATNTENQENKISWHKKWELIHTIAQKVNSSTNEDVENLLLVKKNDGGTVQRTNSPSRSRVTELAQYYHSLSSSDNPVITKELSKKADNVDSSSGSNGAAVVVVLDKRSRSSSESKKKRIAIQNIGTTSIKSAVANGLSSSDSTTATSASVNKVRNRSNSMEAYMSPRMMEITKQQRDENSQFSINLSNINTDSNNTEVVKIKKSARRGSTKWRERMKEDEQKAKSQKEKERIQKEDIQKSIRLRQQTVGYDKTHINQTDLIEEVDEDSPVKKRHQDPNPPDTLKSSTHQKSDNNNIVEPIPVIGDDLKVETTSKSTASPSTTPNIIKKSAPVSPDNLRVTTEESIQDQQQPSTGHTRQRSNSTTTATQSRERGDSNSQLPSADGSTHFSTSTTTTNVSTTSKKLTSGSSNSSASTNHTGAGTSGGGSGGGASSGSKTHLSPLNIFNSSPNNPSLSPRSATTSTTASPRGSGFREMFGNFGKSETVASPRKRSSSKGNESTAVVNAYNSKITMLSEKFDVEHHLRKEVERELNHHISLLQKAEELIQEKQNEIIKLQEQCKTTLKDNNNHNNHTNTMSATTTTTTSSTTSTTTGIAKKNPSSTNLLKDSLTSISDIQGSHSSTSNSGMNEKTDDRKRWFKSTGRSETVKVTGTKKQLASTGSVNDELLKLEEERVAIENERKTNEKLIDRFRKELEMMRSKCASFESQIEQHKANEKNLSQVAENLKVELEDRKEYIELINQAKSVDLSRHKLHSQIKQIETVQERLEKEEERLQQLQSYLIEQAKQLQEEEKNVSIKRENFLKLINEENERLDNKRKIIANEHMNLEKETIELLKKRENVREQRGALELDMKELELQQTEVEAKMLIVEDMVNELKYREAMVEEDEKDLMEEEKEIEMLKANNEILRLEIEKEQEQLEYKRSKIEIETGILDEMERELELKKEYLKNEAHSLGIQLTSLVEGEDDDEEEEDIIDVENHDEADHVENINSV